LGEAPLKIQCTLPLFKTHVATPQQCESRHMSKHKEQTPNQKLLSRRRESQYSEDKWSTIKSSNTRK